MEDDSFEQELHKQLAYWQKVLYLQDWNIDLRICRIWEMDDNALASCEWFLQRKDAIIRVLHSSDIGAFSQTFINDEECDYDISIVHELLHLHFAPFDNKDIEIPIEQAINAISRGMVKTWRGTPTPVETPVDIGSRGYL